MELEVNAEVTVQVVMDVKEKLLSLWNRGHPVVLQVRGLEF